jgi:hypothetical protein
MRRCDVWRAVATTGVASLVDLHCRSWAAPARADDNPLCTGRREGSRALPFQGESRACDGTKHEKATLTRVGSNNARRRDWRRQQ